MRMVFFIVADEPPNRFILCALYELRIIFISVHVVEAYAPPGDGPFRPRSMDVTLFSCVIRGVTPVPGNAHEPEIHRLDTATRWDYNRDDWRRAPPCRRASSHTSLMFCRFRFPAFSCFHRHRPF